MKTLYLEDFNRFVFKLINSFLEIKQYIKPLLNKQQVLQQEEIYPQKSLVQRAQSNHRLNSKQSLVHHTQHFKSQDKDNNFNHYNFSFNLS